jgi:hypothetical protein
MSKGGSSYVYRPNNYRPGSSGWVSRSPSPDHYEPPARHSDSDYWERTGSWRGPPPLEEFVNRNLTLGERGPYSLYRVESD